MRNYVFKTTLAAILVAGLLSACGGGDDSPPDTRATFGAAYGSGLANMSTAAGLQRAALLDVVDAGFLDAAYNRAKMASNFSADAASLSGATAVSLFPMVSLSNPVITCPTSGNICSFTGTITNTDADATEASFTTPVIFSDGAFRLYGDQASS